MFSEDDVIYHYCNVDTFLKIMQNRTVFLSSSREKNDPDECRNFDKYLEEAKDFFKGYPEEEKRLVYDVFKRYSKIYDFPYTASFSKSSDKLELWDRYADNGKGVAIGFALNKLSYYDLMNEKHGKGTPIITIDEISYNDHDLTTVKNFGEAALILLRKGFDREFVIMRASAMMRHLSAFTKFLPYAGENEIRMVYTPCYPYLLKKLTKIKVNPPGHLPIKFRESGGKIISYFEYSCPVSSIDSITLGPKSAIDIHELTLFLASVAPSVKIKDKVFKSKIHIR